MPLTIESLNPGDIRLVFNDPVVAEPLSVVFDFDPESDVSSAGGMFFILD